MSKLFPKDVLKKSYLKQKIKEIDLQNFKNAIDKLKSNTLLKIDETEEHIKSFTINFFNAIQYTEYDINTKGYIDLTITNKNKIHPEILIEIKKPSNKTEMVSENNLNKKALHELLLYYLREKLKNKNYYIRHLIITNNLEWYIFDSVEFDKLATKEIENIYIEKEVHSNLFSTNNDDFYPIIQDKLKNSKILDSIKFTRFNLQDAISPKQYEHIYKLLSPKHLLKEYGEADSNTLNKKFYNELLYILGLEEYDNSGKKLIGRAKNRQIGTLIESTIQKLKSEHYISDENKQFEIALKLVIIWLNRILFLKLLEAKLQSIHNNKYTKFMSYKVINDYDMLNTLFFEVLAKKIEDRENINIKAFDNIPYLNSSLFEVSKEENQYEKISNLSNTYTIKPYKATILDIKDDINSLEYLLRFLDSYDFGSDEHSEYSSDRLINSAVLGLIFEKINGYKDGSFYTPSYITMYMTREALQSRLIQLYNDKYKKSHNNIDDILEDDYDKKELSDMIDSITICDPAVGSGHFIVSMLNEILALKSRLKVLLDENNRRVKLYITVENDELYVEDEDGVIFEYILNENNTLSKENIRIQKTIFTQKQRIIENQLFGVDINPNSVKITRLRLWIELLKHSYYDENNHLTTLPNIDINIKEGNSLISKYQLHNINSQNLALMSGDLIDTKKNKKIVMNNVDLPIELLTEYKDNVNKYKHTMDKNDKYLLTQKISTIKETLSSKLEKQNIQNRDFIELLYQYFKAYGLYGVNATIICQYSNEIYEYFEKDDDSIIKNRLGLFGDTKLDTKLRSKHLEEINNLYTNIIEISNKNNNSFEWRFEFPEVLDDDGEFVGFDIVIGNPPYIRQEEIKELKPLLNKAYKVYNGTADIYVYFYERGFDILKQNGVLSYITSNKYTRAKYGKELREYILKNDILEYIDFNGIKVFDEATVDTSIITIKKSNTKDSFYYLGVQKDFDTNNMSNLQKQILNKSYLSIDSFTFSSSDEMALKQKIESVGTPLKEWDININYGIKTGYNEAFIIDCKKKDELIAQDSKNAEIIKPLLRGRDIKKYEVNFADKWLINVHNGIKSKKLNPIDIDDYPTIKQHLDKYYHYLEKRTDKSDTPYNLRNCAYLDDFEKEKIVWIELCDKAQFALDNKCYTLAGTFIMNGNNLKYLLAFLNSKLSLFYFDMVATSSGVGTNMWKKYKIELLPIPKISIEEQKPFELLVDEIIDKKAKGIDTSELETKIDDMVYALYNLTPEEIDIVKTSIKN